LGQTFLGTYNENYIFGSLDVYNPTIATTTTTSTTTTTTTLAAVEFAIGYFCGTTTAGLADILVDNFSGGSGSYEINTQVYATQNAALNGTFSPGTSRTFTNNIDGTYWVAIRDANNISNAHANQIVTICATTTTTTTTSTTSTTTTLAPTTTTTTTTTTTSTSTTTSTTTLGPLDFNIIGICGGFGDITVDANTPSGGVGPYQFGSTYFLSEASALLNTSWLTSTSISYGVGGANNTFWVVMRDSLGTLLAKSVTTTCTSTTTTTTLAPATTTSTTTTTTTNLVFTTFSLTYNVADGQIACSDYVTPINRNDYYSTAGATLTTGTILYTTSALTTPVANGFYSNGTNYWNTAANAGNLQNQTICTIPTTSTTTTTTTLPITTTTTTTSTSTTTTTQAPIIVQVGSTALEACYAPIQTPTVTYNTASFCTATNLSSASFATLSNGNYFVSYLGDTINMNISGAPTTLGTIYSSGCQACPATTTTTTTTSTSTTTSTTTLPTTTTTTSTTTIQPVSFSISQSCASGTAVITIDNFAGGTSGLYQVNTQVYTSEANAIAGTFINASAPYQYSSVPDGTWYVCVRDRNNNVYLAVNSIATNCATTTTTTTSTTSTTTTQAPISVTVGVSAFEACYLPLTTAIATFNTTTFCTATTITSASFATLGNGNYYVQYLGDTINMTIVAGNPTGTIYSSGCQTCPATTTTTTSTTTTTTTQNPISVTVGATDVAACYSPIQTATATYNTSTYCSATTLSSASFATLPNGNYYVSYLGQTINMNIAGAPTTIGTIYSSGCQNCPATTTTTTSTSTTTTTAAPVIYTIDNGANGSAYGACTGSVPTSTVYAEPGNTVPIVGLILYTNQNLTTPFVGSIGYRKLVNPSATSYAAVVDTSGQITSYSTCASVTTSTTTTTSTQAPVPYTIDNGGNGNPYGACTGSVPTSTVYAEPGNTVPIVGLILYTNQSLTTPFVGGAGYRKLVNVSLTSYAAVVDTNGEITSYSTCASITTTTTTTSTTTTTTTLSGVQFGVSISTKYATDYLACTGTVTGTVYQKAQFGNTPTVGAQLYTSSTTGSGTEWTPSAGIGLYLMQFGGSTKWSVLVGTTGIINTVTSCVGVSTTTTTTTIPIYTYLGNTNPTYSTLLAACQNYSTIRPYYSTKSNLNLIGPTDIIYDSYPSTPTNGNNLWVALTSGGVNPKFGFQIGTNGAVLTSGGDCANVFTTSTTTTTTTLGPTYVWNTNNASGSADGACNAARAEYIWSYGNAWGVGFVYYAGTAEAPLQPLQPFLGGDYYYENGGIVINIDDNGVGSNYQPCPTTTTTTSFNYTEFIGTCDGQRYWIAGNYSDQQYVTTDTGIVPSGCLIWFTPTNTPTGTQFFNINVGDCSGCV
jgi:hypothetical protein